VKKGITPEIINYLNPITLAAWFCGDGGKADYTANEGKGNLRVALVWGRGAKPPYPTTKVFICILKVFHDNGIII